MGMRNGRVATLALTAAMMAAVAALLAGPIRALPPPAGGMRLPWPVLAALIAAAVLLEVHIQFRREVHSVNLVELPLVLGLHLVGPGGLVIAQLGGSLLALVVGSRQTGRKLAFNLSLAMLEACVASLVFATVLGGRAPDGTSGMGATFSA